MQVAPNSDGIQKLLGAEQEASRIVAEARKGAVSVQRAPRALPCIRCSTQHSERWIFIQLQHCASSCTLVSPGAAMTPGQQHDLPLLCWCDQPALALTDLVLLTAAKAERLRQAKSEAEKEIAAYRAEREGAYQKKLAEVRAVCAVWFLASAAVGEGSETSNHNNTNHMTSTGDVRLV
jgi:hypothetical protein